jgi:serine/threonine protein kinase
MQTPWSYQVAGVVDCRWPGTPLAGGRADRKYRAGDRWLSARSELSKPATGHRELAVMTAPCRTARPRIGAPQAPVRAGDSDAGVLLAGRYRLAELVGHGATARVWRAHDELLDQDVAVKQFREPHPHGLAEAGIAARVRHPHVAAVRDMVQHVGSYCLVMDYHPGATLAALLRRRRRMPPPIVAALGLQLLDALQAVHAAGIVHCDVKPANLLLGDDGRLVLVDFGIAESSGDLAHPARRNGDVIGSPAYMAPELIRGEAPRPAADLWSLGATLYTAVEGHAPFPHAHAEPTLAAVLHDAPSPARLAGRLQSLLARLLVKNPGQRPSYDAIRAVLTDLCPDPPIPILATWRSAADLRAAEPASAGAVPGPDGHPSGTMPCGGRLEQVNPHARPDPCSTGFRPGPGTARQAHCA